MDTVIYSELDNAIIGRVWANEKGETYGQYYGTGRVIQFSYPEEAASWIRLQDS